jgi:hypothetical protein
MVTLPPLPSVLRALVVGTLFLLIAVRTQFKSKPIKELTYPERAPDWLNYLLLTWLIWLGINLSDVIPFLYGEPANTTMLLIWGGLFAVFVVFWVSVTVFSRHRRNKR